MRFLLSIPVDLLILYLALIFESTGFALLGFFMAVMEVLSFVVLLWQRKRVSVDLSVPLRTAQKGQKFSIRMQIQNNAALPIGRIGVSVGYGERKQSKRERILFMIEKVQRGKNTITRSLSVQGAGDYEFIAQRIRIYDPFGLFYLCLGKKSIAHVMILPDIEEVPVRLGEAVKHFYGEPVAYDDLRAGNDPSETFGVREFRDGDKLHRVHWKLSARTDELVVKEDAQPKCCPVILIMPEGNGTDGECLDYMASLSFTLMDQHCGHYMVWHSASRGDLVRARVDDEESFYFAVMAYLQDGSAGSGEVGGRAGGRWGETNGGRVGKHQGETNGGLAGRHQGEANGGRAGGRQGDANGDQAGRWQGEKDDDRLARYREKYKAEPYLHSVLANEKGEISVDGTEAFKVAGMREELILN